MKEIGGYIEFEHYHGRMLHDDGIKLDCGRSCLAYLIEAKNIKRLFIPSFMCDSIFKVCKQYNVEMDYYEIGYDFRPENLRIQGDGYLYLTNYFGQISEREINEYKARYKKIIVDNAQAFFDEPIEGVDTLYTCRKYFGVPDGGILFTDTKLSRDIPQSESYNQMQYLLGRFEKTASEFYEQSKINNNRFENQPVKQMSKLTNNLLCGINYDEVSRRREENFDYLKNRFLKMNQLSLKMPKGPYAYPLFVSDNSDSLRERLAQENIYIPILWPNVIRTSREKSVDYNLAMNVLPLPCDQRYSIGDMKYMADKISELL